MKKWVKVSLIGCGSVAFLFIAIVLIAVIGIMHIQKQANSCEIKLPDGSAIVFYQKSIHPFLAEYEYHITFPNGDECSLPVNCGGRTFMNVYWYDKNADGGPCLRFKDHWGNSIIDMSTHKSLRVINYKNRVFLGEITNGTKGYSIGESNGKIECKVDGKQAIDITGRELCKEGRYIGVINGKNYSLCFIPATQIKETEIHMVGN